uniref:Uncharacterized protein LOC107366134 n=1 Tax=Tetranychus evansi TaxID=178897 RepID=A0A3G5AQ62_9ACAR|nr:uncharacterized protein LOC107366134 [Tetranychus evansi]
MLNMLIKIFVNPMAVINLIGLMTKFVDSSEILCQEYNSWNGCKNPFEAKCDSNEGKCVCTEANSLYENGYCLRRILAIHEACWINGQCLMTGTRCFTKDGKGDSLDSVIESLWVEYVSSNGSDLLIPGLCQCNIGYVFDLIEGKCIPRLIDTPCLTDYDCLRRSSFSRCYINKCICSLKHLYNSRSDKCVFFGDVLWPRRSCFEGSCRSNGNFNGNSNSNNPNEQYFYNHSMANIFGFSLSMTVLMMVWIVVRNCARARLSDRVIRLDELRYSDLRVTYDPFEINRSTASGIDVVDQRSVHSFNRENLPAYEDIQPPSYEEAVIKLGESAAIK